MLIFDKYLALFIAIVFGMAGLPWAFWLFKKEEKFGIFEKAVFGYMLGLLMVPALFLLEFIVGLKYNAAFIIPNWILVFIGGIVAYFYPKPEFKLDLSFMQPKPSWLYPLAVIAIMFVMFSIYFSVSGTPIFELDPYFYIDGVRQVIYEGYNYANDGTAWYPLPLSDHIGNPLWKYQMASWFSLFNGNAPYNQFALMAVTSVFPPIVGALTIFFAYLLFRLIYNPKVGVLAAGVIAFMPIMLIKFQGGDVQIEPYNILTLVVLFFSIAYALMHYKEKRAVGVFLAGYAMTVLLSNLSSLILISIPTTLGLVSLMHFFDASLENKERRQMVLQMVGVIVLVQAVFFLYLLQSQVPIESLFMRVLPHIIVPAIAALSPWAIEEGLKKYYNDVSTLEVKITALAVIGFVGFCAFLLLQAIPQVHSITNSYLLFGAYTDPLYRTIAEQAPGSEYYSGQLGFMAMPLRGLENPSKDFSVSMYSSLFTLAEILNAIPTLVTNLIYSIFVSVMNSVSGVDTFLDVQKGNSLLTFFAFWGTVLPLAYWAWAVLKKEEWPIDALIFLPFTIPVLLMSFGKQKLVMYLAVALLFLVGISAFRLWRSAVSIYCAMAGRGKAKKGHNEAHEPTLLPSWTGHALTVIVALLVLLQFTWPALASFQLPSQKASPLYTALGSMYMSNSLPMFNYAFVPRIYDNPREVKAKLDKYCEEAPQDSICPSVIDWNNTINNPGAIFNPELCARSIIPYANKPIPSDFGNAYGYRCSLVSGYWLDSMDWIDKNLGDNDRMISWWDYGHWINFFGRKKAVLRNEHASLDMIGATAHAYLHGDAKELRETMKKYGSRYALMDIEILGSGTSKADLRFGGKYGALNYLGCAWANETSVEKMPGQSMCENTHLPEQMLVPSSQDQAQQCVISESTRQGGFVAYRIELKSTAKGLQQTPVPAFCATMGKYANGREGVLTYDLNSRDASGDLKPYYAKWVPQMQDESAIVFSAVYDNENLWKDASGNLVPSYPYRSYPIYNSTLYQGFFLDQIEGFELVYSSPQIRIFKMTDAYWNGGN